MTQRYRLDFQPALERITDSITDAQLRLFTQRFYQALSLGDLDDIAPEIAVQIAALVYHDAHHLPSDKPKITIHTPDFLKQAYGRTRVAVTIFNKDMPFLVDSLSIALKNCGFTMYRTIHPQLSVKRDEKGMLLDNDHPSTTREESCIYFEISPLSDDMDAKKLEAHLCATLDHVYKAVEDWRIMVARAREISTHIVMMGHHLPAEDMDEATAFFDWLLKNNFIFLGYVAYDFYDAEGKECFTPVEGSQLGVFKIAEFDLLQRGYASLPPEVRHFALQDHPIEITKSNRRSVVHRDVLMDYIGIKRYDAAGKVIGESRFLGLFTSPVYYQQTQEIPYIRQKVRAVLDSTGFSKGGHSGKALKAALEFFPRDELFQISTDDLLEITMGIVALEERPDIRVFFRKDIFERFMSCFVYMPRDKFNTFVLHEIGKVLARHVDGSIKAMYSQLTESALARVHFIVKTQPGHIPAVNMPKLNEELRFIINYWRDSLRESLHDVCGEQRGEHVFREFSEAFPRDYTNTTRVEDAIKDIFLLKEVLEHRTARFNLYVDEATSRIHLKMYRIADRAPLSDMIPMIENLGFKVHDAVPYRVYVRQGAEEQPIKMVVRDFTLLPATADSYDLEKIKPLLEEVLEHVWSGATENDILNSLALRAGLNTRHITILRAYTRYAKQAGLGYSEAYIDQALCKHATIAAQLIALFEARFHPQTHDKTMLHHCYEHVMHALTHVDNLAEDRILRFFAETIQATLRTNAYQQDADGNVKPYLSFKFDSLAVPDLPLPRPFREIFVYSLATEGIHLRGGLVARGGLRWSDRHEDFRTEVLGLMKAQRVKNTVIVPTGSKGGFVVKQSMDGMDRDAKVQAAIASYTQFLSGLLDITDNRRADAIIVPHNVVRYDEDDPYLVVAADKGTATFSDIANAIAHSYGFWLGDAFASGGSVGYDHKKMAITARGGWVSVERHFQEMGRDIHTQPFTVMGIGDMSGDVFGNGMLLSQQIALVGAFNHMHIFLDPTPDPMVSYHERKRLFDIARGSWDGYDAALISQGGGVFLRSAKTIILTPEIQQLLGTNAKELTPHELIRVMLQAPVDLLWNGGIGTYVKSRNETHEMVGDPSNNAVRINGDELRCRVVGEGGNLGFTQLGRSEYARLGGRINTDAIDNSAGVDCSDHEVNIKIALTHAISKGAMNEADRNPLLARMTDRVAELVLEDNRQQNQALSMAQARAKEMLEVYARYMLTLEQEAILDRAVEFLPNPKEIDALKANGATLTRPELAILLAYSKIALYGVLSQSSLLDSCAFNTRLLRYFPEAMQESMPTILIDHPLRREIIATSLTNEIVNRAGITYIDTIKHDTGHDVCNIVRAYVVTQELFQLDSLWEAIEALPNKVESSVQIQLFMEVTAFLERMSVWFLNNMPQPLDMEGVIRDFHPAMESYRQEYQHFISQSMTLQCEEKITSLEQQHIPHEVAKRLAMLDILLAASDIVLLDQQSPHQQRAIGTIYFDVDARLELDGLRHAVSLLSAETSWDRLAVRNVINELYEEQRRLTSCIMEGLAQGASIDEAMQLWERVNEGEIERYRRMVHDLKTATTPTLSMFVVLLRKLATIRFVPND
ncbi:MAG: NAD-glutamate dehydrogenase [Alphaproteobacteria bacterium]|nr:MAG: NAD-glutamate dehydrogenase [Alphaproteobacteria bacterium]